MYIYNGGFYRLQLDKIEYVLYVVVGILWARLRLYLYIIYKYMHVLSDRRLISRISELYRDRISFQSFYQFVMPYSNLLYLTL